MKLLYTSKPSYNQSVILLAKKDQNLDDLTLTSTEKDYVKKQIRAKVKQIHLNLLNRWVLIQIVDDKKDGNFLNRKMKLFYQ